MGNAVVNDRAPTLPTRGSGSGKDRAHVGELAAIRVRIEVRRVRVSVDFHGVRMTWVGEMVAEDLFLPFKNPYLPSLIQRLTNWIYYANKPVYLLREPRGPVWVMQEYTKAVDPSVDIDNLHEVGRKLKNLPKGWTFETKVLTKSLSLDTGRGDGWASIIRDEPGNTYQACGYGGDTSANYVP